MAELVVDLEGEALTDLDDSRASGWLPWSVWVLTLVAMAASTTELLAAPTLEIIQEIGSAVGTLAVATIGALAITRGQSTTPGWLLLGFAFLWAVSRYAYQVLELIAGTNPADLAAAHVAIAVGDVAAVVALFGLIYLFLVMPDGWLRSDRWIPIARAHWGIVGFWVAQSILLAFTVVDLDTWLSRSTLISIDGADPGPFLTTATLIGGVVSSVWLLLVPIAVVSRYRASSGEERQQLKWVMFGAFAILAWLALWIPTPTGGLGITIQSLLPGLALLTLATCFGLALFRYRLWDVDVVIRRSLVYGILWLAIAASYIGVAAALGLFAGARFPVEVAIILTVVATLVFQPARRWLERLADRVVFGRRDTAVETIQGFGNSVGKTDGPRDIAGELAEVTSRVPAVSTVRVEIDGATHVTSGEWIEGVETTVPVSWGAETFGVVRCMARRGEHLSDEDVGLIEALATQAAMTVSHAQLAARMVTAQEQERRRIERDIHDGVQQDLAAQIGQIALARTRAPENSDFNASLERIQTEMQRTLSEIRDLAQGIHPSVLRDHGLYAAIGDRIDRLPIRVSLSAPPDLDRMRFADDIETAAYFTVTEAVANIIKHSGSATARVKLSRANGHLTIEVGDEGCGFDTTAVTGSGLTGLSDRLRVLGGDFVVESHPGSGTVVTGVLPIRAAGGDE